MNSGFHPHIPLGYTVDPDSGKYSDGSVAFCLVLNTHTLQPTREMDWAHGTDYLVLPPEIMGINFRIQHNAPQDYLEEFGFEEEDRPSIGNCIQATILRTMTKTTNPALLKTMNSS